MADKDLREIESAQQSVRNAIRLVPTGGTTVEISKFLKRLGAVTQRTPDERRYYVPKDVRADAQKLATEWK